MNTKLPSPLFLHAAGHILDLEGGRVNHAADKGGDTNLGISDARDGKKDGLIDLDNDGTGDITPAKLTKEQALGIYCRDYWLACRCDELPPALAIVIFDAAVNQGVDSASKLLQRSLNTVADGRIGPVTVRAASNCNVQQLLHTLLVKRAWLYHSIVKADSSQAVFLEGWFSRLFKLQIFILASPPSLVPTNKPVT